MAARRGHVELLEELCDLARTAAKTREVNVSVVVVKRQVWTNGLRPRSKQWPRCSIKETVVLNLITAANKEMLRNEL